MWLPGFDVYFLDTIYVDKAIQRHNLIQTISRINSKLEGNDKGLVDDKPIFNGLFISTLLGISLSISRGIIFEQFGRKGISNVLLPVVSPQKILKSDAIG